MTRSPRANPQFIGTGSFLVYREQYRVAYSIESNDALKSGKGWASGAPETMQLAFATGAVVLTLEDGLALRVTFVGYTKGGDKAYFEIDQPSRT